MNGTFFASVRKNVGPWVGVFGGALCWYAAHEIGTYFSDYNCKHRGILPVVHLAAFIGSFVCGWLSYRAFRNGPPGVGRGARSHVVRTADKIAAPARDLIFDFESPAESPSLPALIGTAAGVLFTLVIFLQGIATLIYTGCER